MDFKIPSYETAKSMLGSRQEVRLGGNGLLTAYTDDGAIGLRYRNNLIAVFTPDGKLTLLTGSWPTKTTLRWLRRCLPEGVAMLAKLDNGQWMISDRTNRIVPFYHGMTVNRWGEVSAGINTTPVYMKRGTPRRSF